MVTNFKHRIAAVDPDRFRFALGVYSAAAAMKGPYLNPQGFGIDLADERGCTSALTFTDVPVNRGMLAVVKEFPDKTEFEHIGFRLMAFQDVMADPKLQKMGVIRKDDAGVTEIHHAVVNAVAMAPFHKSGALDKRAFLALVKSEFERLEAIEVSAI